MIQTFVLATLQCGRALVVVSFVIAILEEMGTEKMTANEINYLN